jgi:hypothetical protein
VEATCHSVGVQKGPGAVHLRTERHPFSSHTQTHRRAHAGFPLASLASHMVPASEKLNPREQEQKVRWDPTPGAGRGSETVKAAWCPQTIRIGEVHLLPVLQGHGHHPVVTDYPKISSAGSHRLSCVGSTPGAIPVEPHEWPCTLPAREASLDTRGRQASPEMQALLWVRPLAALKHQTLPQPCAGQLPLALLSACHPGRPSQ